MARIDNLTNFLTDVADAIRDKKGTSGEISCANFDTEIASISGGGVLFSAGTVTIVDGSESPVIEHGLGVIPTIVMYATNTSSSDKKVTSGFYTDLFNTATRYNTLKITSQYGVSPRYVDSESAVINMDEDFFELKTPLVASTFEWFALYFEK